MSVVVMSRVWEKSPQKGSNLLLTLALADSANHSGVGYAGIAYLKDRIRMSERNTERLMDSLEQSGEIFRRKGNGRGVKTYFAVLTSLDQNAIAKVLEEHAEQFQLTSDEIETHAKSIIEKRRNFAALKKSAKKSPIKRGNSKSSKAEKVTKSSKKGAKSIREKSGDQPHDDTPNPATPEPRSVDPLNTDIPKGISSQPTIAVAVLETTSVSTRLDVESPIRDTPPNGSLDLPASQVLTTEKNLLIKDQFYIHYKDTAIGPFKGFRTANEYKFAHTAPGTITQGSGIKQVVTVVPPDEKRTTPDPLFSWVAINIVKNDPQIAYDSKRLKSYIFSLIAPIVNAEKRLLKVKVLPQADRDRVAGEMDGWLKWYQAECNDCPVPQDLTKFEKWINQWYQAGKPGGQAQVVGTRRIETDVPGVYMEVSEWSK